MSADDPKNGRVSRHRPFNGVALNAHIAIGANCRHMIHRPK